MEAVAEWGSQNRRQRVSGGSMNLRQDWIQKGQLKSLLTLVSAGAGAKGWNPRQRGDPVKFPIVP